MIGKETIEWATRVPAENRREQGVRPEELKQIPKNKRL
jgi:hypothetical protein